MTEIDQVSELYVYRPSHLNQLAVKREVESKGGFEIEVSSRKRQKSVKNSEGFHYLPKEILYEIFSYIGWNGQDALHYALAGRQYYQIAMSHPLMRMGHTISRLKDSGDYATTQQACFEGVLIPRECALGQSEVEKLHQIDPQGVGFNRLLHSATDFTGLGPVLQELFKALTWYPELTMNSVHDQKVKAYAQTVHALFTKLFEVTTLDDETLSGFDWKGVPRLAIDYQRALSIRDVLESKTPPQFDGWESNEAYFHFCLESNGLLLEKASAAIQDNEKFVLKAVRQNGKALQFASERLRNNKEIVLAAVKNDGMALPHASLECRADRDIVWEAALMHPTAIYYADHAITGDISFALALLKHRKEIFTFISPQLREDPAFILRALSINGLVLGYLSEENRKERDLVLAAVAQNGLALEYADDDLKADPKIVQTALKQNALAAEYMAERFEKIKQVALFAVSEKGIALEFFESFQDDYEVVVKAVEQDGLALEHASDRLRGIFSFAYRAVRQNGLALKHVEELGDNEMFIVVQEAVKQNGLALEFAADLQDNEEIVKWAILQNPQAFRFASERLRARGDLAAIAALKVQA